MGYFSFPHTRTYDSDLGWLIKKIGEIDQKLSEYLENAVISFADPIEWNITEQYTALTMVIDSDGTAYLSRQPVPAGVDISNTDYWMPIFNYDDNINKLRSQIAYNAENLNTITEDIRKNDLLFWRGLLYKALADIPAGSALIIGSNIEKYTVNDRFGDLSADIGNINTEINGLSEAIENETLARENADLNLQNQIDNLRDVVIVFDTVSDMVSSEDSFDIGVTRGYYSVNDGGGSVYRKSSTRVDILDLSSETAFFHIIGDHNLKTLGATGGGDISALLSSYYKVYDTLSLDDDYKISDLVTIENKSFKLDLNGHTISASNNTVFAFTNCDSFTVHGGSISGAYRAFKIYNCTDFTLSDLNITDYGFFSITLEACSRFEISRVVFDARAGAAYTDGVHFYNGVSDGVLTELSGYTGDDFIALNSLEREVGTSSGGIKNIRFININTGNSYSAVRFYNQNRGDDLIDNIVFEYCTLSGGTSISPLRFTNDESGNGDTSVEQMRAGSIRFIGCKFASASNLTMDSIIRFARVNIDSVIFEQCEFINNASNLTYLINSYYDNIFTRFMLDGCTFNGTTSGIPYRMQRASVENFIFKNARHITSVERAAIQLDFSTVEKVTIDDVYVDKTAEFLNLANSNIKSVTITKLIGDYARAVAVFASGAVKTITVNDCYTNRVSGGTAVHFGIPASAETLISINNFFGGLPYNATFYGSANLRFRSLGVVAYGIAPPTGLNGDCYTFIDSSTGAATMRLYNNGWISL